MLAFSSLTASYAGQNNLENKYSNMYDKMTKNIDKGNSNDSYYKLIEKTLNERNKELKDFTNRLKTKKEIEEVSKWIHDLNHSGFFEELNKTAYAFIREFLRNRNKFKVEGERNLLLIINEAIRFGVTDMCAIVENSYCEG